MSLSWKERPLRELLRLAGPIAASTLSYSLMTLVDTLLIGRVGRAELAGVALGGLFCFVLLCFSFGLLRGAKTLVSQAVGARRPEEVPAQLGAAVLVALALGVATALAGQIVARLVVGLAASEAAGRAAATYLGIRIWGAPLVLVYVALREVCHGRGDTRAPMTATIAGNLVNVALAYWLIFALGLGVAGAAAATIVGSGVELLVLALRCRGLGIRLRGVGGQARELWRLGVSIGLQFTLEIGSFSILALIISLLSEAEMAAHQIAIQCIHFSFLPAWATAEAASVLAGQAVGAGQDRLVVRVGRIAAAAAVGYAALCAAVFALGAPLIARGFTADPTVVAVATRLLYVAAAFQIFDALNIVARGVLRGAGDVRYAAVVGIVSAWLCTPPLTWLLGWKLGMGAFGGWLGLCLEIVVGAVILVVRVERGGWLWAAERARARLARPAAAA